MAAVGGATKPLKLQPWVLIGCQSHHLMAMVMTIRGDC